MAVVTSYSPKKGRKSLQKWRCLCIGNPDGKTLKNCWRLSSVRHGSSVDFFQLPFLLLRVLLKKSCNLLDVWTFPGWILGRGYNWKIRRRRRRGRWVRRLRRRNRMTRSRWRCLWGSQASGPILMVALTQVSHQLGGVGSKSQQDFSQYLWLKKYLWSTLCLSDANCCRWCGMELRAH